MRKRLLVPLGVVVALALVAGGLWVWWVPHYRPSLRAGETYGIDVSHHQGAIDWRRVRADGIEWAYIKGTEGGDHRDPRFVENWFAAKDAGLARGQYHFFTLCRSGAEQAANAMLQATLDAELPPAVDLELAGNCSARPPREEVARELAAFLDVVEAAGRRVVLYVGEDWRSHYGLPEGDRVLWLRSVLRRPSGEWGIWQVQGRARIEGISGPVDLNVMRAGARVRTHG